MSVFPDWQSFAVHQRRPLTGCIPTGYEMILRAANAEGIDFTTFQDDFDHDINLGNGQTVPRNDFGSVGDSVRTRYPWVHFEQKFFSNGAAKIAFIDSMLSQHEPVLISLAMTPYGGQGWHIMPVVDATSVQYLLLEYVHSDGTPKTQWIDKAAVSSIHDNYDGGKEIAFLARLDKPQTI